MVACELRAYDSRRTGLRAIELESSMGFIEHALISGSVPIGGGGEGIPACFVSNSDRI